MNVRLFWRFLMLGGEERRYLITAAVYLLRARLAHAMRDSKAILERLEKSPPVALSPDTAFDVRRACWAIGAVGRHAPWRSDCLIQAMAGVAWLRHHGYAPRFHLGVTSTSHSGLAGHAWLSLDSAIVLGADADEAGPAYEALSPASI
jgi:hypothetical protein